MRIGRKKKKKAHAQLRRFAVNLDSAILLLLLIVDLTTDRADHRHHLSKDVLASLSLFPL